MSLCDDVMFIPMSGPIGPTGPSGTGLTGPTGPSLSITSLLFHAERNSDTTIVVPNNTATDVVFNDTMINTGYIFDGVTLTIPRIGYYKISSQISLGDVLTAEPGTRSIIINVNNTVNYTASLSSANQPPDQTQEVVTPMANILLQLNAGDQIKIQAYQDSGEIFGGVQVCRKPIFSSAYHMIWFDVQKIF